MIRDFLRTENRKYIEKFITQFFLLLCTVTSYEWWMLHAITILQCYTCKMLDRVTYQSGGHHFLKPLGLGLIVKIHTAHQVISWKVQESNTLVFSSQCYGAQKETAVQVLQADPEGLQVSPGGAEGNSITWYLLRATKFQQNAGT